MKEIEKKFLIKPIIGLRNGVEIEQYYISRDPEIRIRKITDIDTQSDEYFVGEPKYFLTIKSNPRIMNGTLVRDEFEIEIPKDLAMELKKLAKLFVSKVRFKVDCEYTKEVVIDSYDEIWLMEAEFEKPEDVEEFLENCKWSKHVIADVTEDERFRAINRAIELKPEC